MEGLERYSGTCIAHDCEIAECTALMLRFQGITSRPLAYCESQRGIETCVCGGIAGLTVDPETGLGECHT